MPRRRRRGRRRRWRGRARPPARRGRGRSPSRCSSVPPGVHVLGRPPPARVGARQPRRERRQVQRAGLGRPGAGARRGVVGRADGRRPRHRHPGPATTTASSSASTGSTRAAGATPAAPASACRSSATWRRTTAATCWCPRRKGRARRSSCASRSTASIGRHPGGHQPMSNEFPSDASTRSAAMTITDGARRRGRTELRRGPVDRAAPGGLQRRGGDGRLRGARPLRHRASPTSSCST